jgi:hypothetical protein
VLGLVRRPPRSCALVLEPPDALPQLLPHRAMGPILRAQSLLQLGPLGPLRVGSLLGQPQFALAGGELRGEALRNAPSLFQLAFEKVEP